MYKRQIYQSKRPDPNAIADTRNRYEATRKDESAADTLRNIADYFVRSDADPETYLGKNSSNFSKMCIRDSLHRMRRRW